MRDWATVCGERPYWTMMSTAVNVITMVQTIQDLKDKNKRLQKEILSKDAVISRQAAEILDKEAKITRVLEIVRLFQQGNDQKNVANGANCKRKKCHDEAMERSKNLR